MSPDRSVTHVPGLDPARAAPWRFRLCFEFLDELARPLHLYKYEAKTDSDCIHVSHVPWTSSSGRYAGGWRRGAHFHPAVPGRQDREPEGSARTVGDFVLLSEGHDQGLHHRGA